MPELRLLDAARFWLAALFLFAGLMKAIRPSTARTYLVRTASITEAQSKSAIAAISIGELVVAFALLLGKAMALSGTLAAASLAFFTGFVIRDQQGLDCGCFGTSAEEGDHRALIATRNSIMIVVAFVVAHDASARPLSDLPTLALGTGFLVWSIGGYIVARAFLTKQLTGNGRPSL
jgi:hypothetical protein